MGRWMAIDYGQKRVGLAVTDPLKIIATSLATVKSNDVFSFLDEYFSREKVERVVLGHPKQMNNQDSESFKYVKEFEKAFLRKYPGVQLVFEDERFTSVLAKRAMVDGGMKKKERMKKENLDLISAVIILQSYMERMENKKTNQ